MLRRVSEQIGREIEEEKREKRNKKVTKEIGCETLQENQARGRLQQRRRALTADEREACRDFWGNHNRVKEIADKERYEWLQESKTQQEREDLLKVRNKWGYGIRRGEKARKQKERERREGENEAGVEKGKRVMQGGGKKSQGALDRERRRRMRKRQQLKERLGKKVSFFGEDLKIIAPISPFPRSGETRRAGEETGKVEPALEQAPLRSTQGSPGKVEPAPLQAPLRGLNIRSPPTGETQTVPSRHPPASAPTAEARVMEVYSRFADMTERVLADMQRVRREWQEN